MIDGEGSKDVQTLICGLFNADYSKLIKDFETLYKPDYICIILENQKLPLK